MLSFNIQADLLNVALLIRSLPTKIHIPPLTRHLQLNRRIKDYPFSAKKLLFGSFTVFIVMRFHEFEMSLMYCEEFCLIWVKIMMHVNDGKVIWLIRR